MPHMSETMAAPMCDSIIFSPPAGCHPEKAPVISPDLHTYTDYDPPTDIETDVSVIFQTGDDEEEFSSLGNANQVRNYHLQLLFIRKKIRLSNRLLRSSNLNMVHEH